MVSRQSTVHGPQRAIKKNYFFVFASFLLWTVVYGLWTALAYAAELSFEEAESKALEAHKLAASDVIYQEQDWKALYYQNLQMISLLKDIKSELETFNARAAKDEIKKEIA